MEGVVIDTAGKLSLWAKEISELIPTEGRNSAQNKLGLTPGRIVPNQLKTSLPDSREDTRRCAFRVEARSYEDIRVFDEGKVVGIEIRTIENLRRSLQQPKFHSLPMTTISWGIEI